MNILEELEKLRRPHLVLSEDCWYSCWKTGDCCNDQADGQTCTCGADSYNAILDSIIAELLKMDMQAIVTILEAKTKEANEQLAEREDEYSLGYWSACYNLLQYVKDVTNTH